MMLGVAVIGAGDMGTKHARAWAMRDDAHVVAICDTNASRCEALTGQHGAAGYGDWREAIAHDGVEVVSVCVPAHLHNEISVVAMQAGKHVLCEKPMALTLAEADAMIEAARANRVKLSISHQYPGLGRYKALKQLVEDGALGSPLFMRFVDMREVRPKLAMHSASLSGGPVHDMTGHLFDLARWLTGCEAESVTAYGAVSGKGKKRLAGIEDLGVDTAEIRAMFEGGHCLSISMNWGLPEGTQNYSHEVFNGPDGVAWFETPDGSPVNIGDALASTWLVVSDGSGVRQVDCLPDSEGPDICIADLVKCVREGGHPEFSADRGRSALALTLAAFDSIRSGETVTIGR